MLEESGRVVAVQGDAVWVQTIRRSTCGACAARQGCGHGLISRHSALGQGLVRALSGTQLHAADCRVGDEVVLVLPEEVILRGSMLVYLVPLLSMLAGALLIDAMFSTPVAPASDLLTLAGAAGGFGLGVALVRWHAWRHRADPSLQPVLAHRVRSAVSMSSIEVKMHV